MLSARARVRLALTLLLAGTNGTFRTVHGENFTCVSPEARTVKRIFGIQVFEPMMHPMLPVLHERACVSDAPHVDVRIGTRPFNLLNATMSVEACLHMYRELICTDLKADIPNECQYANLIMFAAAEGMAVCTTDSDCSGNRSRHELPGLWCDWALEMSKQLCATPKHVRFADSCAPDARTGTRIRGACVFTNGACAFIVHNISLLAPLSGIGMFLVSFTIIYFTHTVVPERM